MANVNEELKKIREAEEEVSRLIREENDRSMARIEEAKKKAEEILKNAEKMLESIRFDLEKSYNEQVEKEISKLREEWNSKMKKLNGTGIERSYIDEIARSLLEEK